MEPVKRLRLKKTHLVYKKLDELFEFMEKLSLRIDLSSGHFVEVTTRDNDTIYLLEDNESKSGEWESKIQEIPPIFEWKVTITNPEYTEYLEKEYEKYMEEKKERLAAQIKTEKERKEQERKRLAEQIKKQELNELKRLKEKYKNI